MHWVVVRNSQLETCPKLQRGKGGGWGQVHAVAMRGQDSEAAAAMAAAGAQERAELHRLEGQVTALCTLLQQAESRARELEQELARVTPRLMELENTAERVCSITPPSSPPLPSMQAHSSANQITAIIMDKLPRCNIRLVYVSGRGGGGAYTICSSRFR